jgi:hypothetical protein
VGVGCKESPRAATAPVNPGSIFISVGRGKFGNSARNRAAAAAGTAAMSDAFRSAMDVNTSNGPRVAAKATRACEMVRPRLVVVRAA